MFNIVQFSFGFKTDETTFVDPDNKITELLVWK